MRAGQTRPTTGRVALLAEGVDRNSGVQRVYFRFSVVALLAEGVDRNHFGAVALIPQAGRPPRGGRG